MHVSPIISDSDCVWVFATNNFPSGFDRDPSPGLRRVGKTALGNPDAINFNKKVVSVFYNFDFGHSDLSLLKQHQSFQSTGDGVKSKYKYPVVSRLSLDF